jgi:hypothetical protein
MPRALYALLCVVVPIAWGLVVVFLSNAIERAARRRRKRDGGKDEPFPPIEYHI